MITFDIKARRERLGLLQSDVAEACGVSAGTVSRWERGEINDMRRDKLKALATVLKINPVLLLDREVDEVNRAELSAVEADVLRGYKNAPLAIQEAVRAILEPYMASNEEAQSYA